MTSSRIRYSKTNQEGFFKSVKKFHHKTNGQSFYVVLNTTEHQWTVVDDGTDIIAASGHNTNFNRMKIEAKKALAELGIEFKEESRIRTKVAGAA